ncbi:DUF4157 domain-containing protein [Streptomyces canus]|uniref:eCIS core domain-containing protein n=1 Tax=Streptomyces canus TaxID=58343 RepID=UPI0036BFEED4
MPGHLFAAQPQPRTKEPPVRRYAEKRVPDSVPPSVYEALRSPGDPLPTSVRSTAEGALAHDFSRVRVHSGSVASKSAAAVGARGYTVGKDVVLGSAAASMESLEDLSLITHELAHVAQDDREYLGGPLALGRADDREETAADAMVSREQHRVLADQAFRSGREQTTRRKAIDQSTPGNPAMTVRRSTEQAGRPGDRPNLDVGDDGPGVVLLQKLLGISATGLFDQATRRAVVAFQQTYDPPSLHPATGGVGRLTWRALEERAQVGGAPQGRPGARPNLELGDIGQGVALLQRLLGLTPTAVFDKQTERAVIAFQESRPSLHPATGGVGPKTWEALDQPAQGKLAVDGKIIGSGRLSLAGAGSVLSGTTEIARGTVTVDGVVLAGGAPLMVFRGGTMLTVPGAGLPGTSAVGAATTDVASTSAEAIAMAQRMQLQVLRQAAQTAAVTTAETAGTAAAVTPTVAVGALAPVAAVGIGLGVGIGIALLPVAVAYAAVVADRLGENGGISLPGGSTAPIVDPSKPGAASAPGLEGGVPAKLPAADGVGVAIAPGEFGHALTMAGLHIPLESDRTERFGKAESVDKWTELPGRDRTSLGKAYNYIIEILVRELAGGGRATVLHSPNLTKALLDQLRAAGGRVVITEGRLSGGERRFDIAEIDFDRKTVELIDLTAQRDPKHAKKTAVYQTMLAELTGFPVTAYEARYVNDNGELADELTFEPSGSK